MSESEKIAWDAMKKWLLDFTDGKEPYNETPAADLLTLVHEAETNQE